MTAPVAKTDNKVTILYATITNRPNHLVMTMSPPTVATNELYQSIKARAQDWLAQDTDPKMCGWMDDIGHSLQKADLPKVERPLSQRHY